MTAEQLAAYISIQTPPAWERCADLAMAHYEPNWLDGFDFDSILSFYEFDAEYYVPRFLRELEVLKGDRTLSRVCWLMHYILFYCPTAEGGSAWGWTGAPKAFAQHGSPVTCVVALLAGHPLHVDVMEGRGYDDTQVAYQKEGVRQCWIAQHEQRGVDGIGFGQMLWGSYFMRGELVRFGRLQYEVGRKRFAKYDDYFKEEHVFVSIHIPPANNGLVPEEVEASFAMAEEKLATYFPQVIGKQMIFYTSSWLLSPELTEILPPESNIIRFQKHFTVLELHETVVPFLGFGFQVTAGPDVDYASLPEDTHLRRELKKRLIHGQPLHTGWGYFIR